MESPRKFNDCYFYYYSTCTKGDNCVFRHEPSALGCETMCSAWQQGKCLDKRCKLRHMELRKNRKQIPCYWENQPGGCRKKHCPFMHKNPDARTDGIAPAQPQPQVSAAGVGVCEPGVGVGMGVGVGVGVGVPVEAGPVPPQPQPMLWHQQHQQRQVVLDSAILGVLPSTELLSRRVVGGVGNVGGVGGVGGVDANNPYGAMPVDPLVVNFEEESDNESAPSTTPTKQPTNQEAGNRLSTNQAATSEPDPSQPDHELLLLERIQQEAAAFYSYDNLPPIDNKPKPRTNLSTKYDRLSLDEIAGKTHPQPTERRKSLDFKILSLDEIRARKKAETIIQTTPIQLNLSRKRKLSTQETVTSSGNKIIKVVRSNSIVYKKLDTEVPTNTAESSRIEQKPAESVESSRKRTISEVSDIYEIQADELVDNCYEFKRIKVTEQTSKPRLIRNRNVSEKCSTETNCHNDKADISKGDNDSDSEVQIVSVDIVDKTGLDVSDCDIIDVTPTVDIVDLSDGDDDDVTITSSDLATNVPDVVASCHKKVDEMSLINDIDSLLNDVNSNNDEEL